MGTCVVMGIDPGEHTGIALYEAGQLKALSEVQPEDIQQTLADHAHMVALVVFEDSRLESAVWTSTGPLPVRLTMARKVGQIDGFCKIIERTCAKLGIPCHSIAPKAKSGSPTGKKIGAPAFNHKTGWKGPSNDHKRDAAMVAWRWRTGVAA